MALKFKQVYLLKDRHLKFDCSSTRIGEYQGILSLFQSRLSSFEPYPNDKYEEKETRDIKEAIDQVYKLPVDNSCLQLVAQYNRICQSFEVMLKVKINSSFAQKLCTDLVEPKFLVQGTFIYINYLATAKNYSNWRPADGTSHTFRVIDIDLKKEQAIPDFEGALKMAEICNKVPEGTWLKLIYSVLLQWRDSKAEFPSVRVNVLEKLLDEKLLADCSFVLSNGTEVKCHRSVLAAHSDVFYTMLTSGFSESTSHKIEMTDVSEEGVNIFLTYLYKDKINTEAITEAIAVELLQTSHKYNVSVLESAMLEMLFNKPNNWYSLDSALSLYFMTANVKAHSLLCEKMFDIIKRNTYGGGQNLRSSALYKELEANNPKEAIDLAFKLLEDAKI